ncbi:C1-like DC1 containing protein [Trema orientale]|uniref:C1-like DC1 containing protein n=1 Tax=Trema orientale TaxID=63057 RepID=A0A2P5CGV5_TREOI|nr:C1-like DC1 containing protein [Trema orientale]
MPPTTSTELPKLLNHSFHPSHPLTLHTHTAYYCDSCHRFFSNVPSFRCVECNIDMDVECAMMPPITFTEVEQGNIIQHFSHQHSMPLVMIDSEDEINCFACQSTLSSSDRVYGCTKCKYFLHELCAELPKEIQFPFHWYHGLLYLKVQHFEFKCALCNESYKTIFTFKCHQCSFQLCMKCSATRIRGTIKYEYHEHLLSFVWENNKPINRCSNYDSYCKRPFVSYGKEISYTSSYAFYCLECDFKVHMICGPLPSMVKHECHIHPLILVDSLIEDTSGEYYCDVCETERDPRIRVYYCEKCKYIAHVQCVASEIINILTGNLRGVELKTLGEDIWKSLHERDIGITAILEELGRSPLTLKDIINELTEREKKNLRIFYKWDDASSDDRRQSEEYSHDTAQSKLGDEDINWILGLSRFTNKDFDELFEEFKRFYLSATLELPSSDLELKIVTVQGYKIPLTLAKVLRALLDKYGDVSSRSKGTIPSKSIVYFILCRVLKRMCSTTVADITKSLLQEWYYHLRFVKFKLFEIGFALANLERLARAFLGLQAKRLENEIPMIINGNISNLQQEIAKLQREVTKEKSKLEQCEKYRGSSAKSKFMEACLNEASTLKWKDACGDMFTGYDPGIIRHSWWNVFKLQEYHYV